MGVAAVACILIIAFLFVFLNQRNDERNIEGTNETGQTNESEQANQTLRFDLEENGDLVIPTDDIAEELTYIDYGGSHQILIWKDNNEDMHTAFNTCQECFSRGNANYTYNNGTLTCSVCGNQIDMSSLADTSWGGCQPVSIPMEYRDDTESEIILSEELLKYSEEMFEAWENGDFSITLETYEK